MSDLSRILADLKRHESMFDLSRNNLGDDLLEIAGDGVKWMFEHHETPDGSDWPALTSDYARWKATHFPGEPMGVRTGQMSSELPGQTTVDVSTATLIVCQSESMRQRLDYFSVRRPFAGLNDRSTDLSTRLLDDHFKDQTS